MSDLAEMLPDASATLEISPKQVASWVSLPREDRPRLIDCREEDELAICRIDGNEWIPLGRFPVAVEQFAEDQERGIVVYCHHGMRSLQATAFLRERGVGKVFSMAGGIAAWSESIDPEVPRY